MLGQRYMDFEREKLVTLSNQQCVAIVEDGDDGGGEKAVDSPALCRLGKHRQRTLPLVQSRFKVRPNSVFPIYGNVPPCEAARLVFAARASSGAPSATARAPGVSALSQSGEGVTCLSADLMPKRRAEWAVSPACLRSHTEVNIEPFFGF